MSTQNLNTPQLRSSGHKQPTEDHQTVAQRATSGDNGNPQSLLQNRLLNNHQVNRAAIYDYEDFECVGSSKTGFKVEADDVRKILDGLLTYGRQNDPTAASGDGQPPTRISLGEEGKADVKDGDGERMIAALNGNLLIAFRTASHVVLVEGTQDANQASLETLVESFQSGLQEIAM